MCHGRSATALAGCLQGPAAFTFASWMLQRVGKSYTAADEEQSILLALLAVRHLETPAAAASAAVAAVHAYAASAAVVAVAGYVSKMPAHPHQT